MRTGLKSFKWLTRPITETEHVDGLEHLAPKTIPGDVLDLVKPRVSEGKLTTLRELAKEIMSEDGEAQIDN